MTSSITTTGNYESKVNTSNFWNAIEDDTLYYPVNYNGDAVVFSIDVEEFTTNIDTLTPLVQEEAINAFIAELHFATNLMIDEGTDEMSKHMSLNGFSGSFYGMMTATDFMRDLSDNSELNRSLYN